MTRRGRVRPRQAAAGPAPGRTGRRGLDATWDQARLRSAGSGIAAAGDAPAARRAAVKQAEAELRRDPR